MLAGTDQTVFVGDGPDGIITPISAGGIVVFPSDVPAEIWSVRFTGPDTRPQLQHLDGSAAGPALTDLRRHRLGDDGTGSLLVQTDDGVVRFDPDGASAQRMSGLRWWPGRHRRSSTEVCDHQLHCEWNAVDRATGTPRSLGVPPPGAVVGGGQLSPDGRWMAYLVVGPGSTEPTLQAIDLTSGTAPCSTRP